MITCRRLYHVSFAVYNLKKQGIKLTKLLNPKSKKQWYPSQIEPVLPSMKSIAKTSNEPGKRGIRRVAMLNKVFMKHITDMMSTGTAAMGIIGRGIEISKVKITPDLQTVHVFWVCKGNSSDEDTEAILNKTAGALRHELSTLRVMGAVPYIAFVKDKQEANLVELDRRLAMADYGDEYTPTEMGHLLKTEFTLNTKLSSEMKAKIKQLEEEIPPLDEPIPEMTHTVYGLDHAKIMNRLLAARKRSRDAWSRLDEESPVISYKAPAVKASDEDVVNQRQELADFLIKRQILQNKLHKQMRSSEEWQLDSNDDHDLDDVCYDDDDLDEIDDYNSDDDILKNDKEINVP